MRIALLVLAGLTILTGIGLTLVFPSSAPDLAPGWFTPIIAFELARTPQDLAFLAGPANEPIRAAMDAGHWGDVVFPLFYGALLALSGWSSPSRWARLALPAGLVAVLADLCENYVLGRITAALRAGTEVEGLLAFLVPATWTKWGAIAVGLAAVGVAEWGRARVGRSLLLACAATVPIAWATGLPVAGEVMALGIVVGFVLLAVRAWRLPALTGALHPSAVDPPGPTRGSLGGRSR